MYCCWRICLLSAVDGYNSTAAMQDTFRSCTGAEKHKRLTHISDSVKDAKVVRVLPHKHVQKRAAVQWCKLLKAFKSILS